MFIITNPNLLHDKEFDNLGDYREGTYEVQLMLKSTFCFVLCEILSDALLAYFNFYLWNKTRKDNKLEL